jgi:hypothetical protein
MSAGTFATHFAVNGWLSTPITVEPWTGGFDDYGNPMHGQATIVLGYVDDKVRTLNDAIGKQRVSTTTLYLAGGPVDIHDRITMPGTFKGPSQPPIIWVANVNDRTGFDHSEVYI